MVPDLLDVDAEARGDVRVRHRGPPRDAGAGRAGEPREEPDDDHREPHHHEPGLREEESGQDLHLRLQRRCGERDAVGSERETVDFLRGDEEPDGRDEGHQRRAVEQGPVAETVDAYADRSDRHHRQCDRKRQAAGLVGHDDPDVAAQRKQRGVSHMEDAQQPVDEGESERDQGIDRALDQTLNRQLQEEHHETPTLTRRPTAALRTLGDSCVHGTSGNSLTGRRWGRGTPGTAWGATHDGQASVPGAAAEAGCPADQGVRGNPSRSVLPRRNELPVEVSRCSATLCMNGPAWSAGPFIAHHSSGGANSTGSEMTA